jgi:hypothetical protein
MTYSIVGWIYGGVVFLAVGSALGYVAVRRIRRKLACWRFRKAVDRYSRTGRSTHELEEQ